MEKVNRSTLSKVEISGIQSVCVGVKKSYKGFDYSYSKDNTKYKVKGSESGH